MIDWFTQFGITLFGGTAIFLVGRKTRRVRRWGFVCGLLSQPCWYVQLALHSQWGMMPVYLFYTFSWIAGFWTHWIAKED